MKRISELEKKYVLEVLENQFETSKNSIFNNKLEKAFAEKFNSQFAIGHVNGTATMHTALVALGVKPGDEVIVPPLTMSSTSLAVLQNGSIPVFADVDPLTFNISPKSIEAVITTKTKAIITVALYGLSPDYDEILKICTSNNIFLIEDNAECFLGKYKGKYVGEFGDFSSFSFQASKHITAGEGGMLTCNNEDFANKARQFSSLGYAGVSAKQGKITKNDIQSPDYNRHVVLGFNYRMSELQAACTLGQLERIEELVQRRIEVANMFDEVVKQCDFLRPQFCPNDYENSYWTYVFVLEKEDPKEWFRFRELWQKNGGDGYYAAWKLSYKEPYFMNEVQNMVGVWQDYSSVLCPYAEYLQPRLIQLKTNYWDIEDARKQVKILQKTIMDY
ncbi:MAG: DegT/DnrJ/EryC1/StrS family aminotransferase [Leadbetterella sp.]|nr:DegT/DnrJ/EryC1/StrS family aminotransferase [Leadbetterella sp.]